MYDQNHVFLSWQSSRNDTNPPVQAKTQKTSLNFTTPIPKTFSTINYFIEIGSSPPSSSNFDMNLMTRWFGSVCFAMSIRDNNFLIPMNTLENKDKILMKMIWGIRCAWLTYAHATSCGLIGSLAWWKCRSVLLWQ